MSKVPGSYLWHHMNQKGALSLFSFSCDIISYEQNIKNKQTKPYDWLTGFSSMLPIGPLTQMIYTQVHATAWDF